MASRRGTRPEENYCASIYVMHEKEIRNELNVLKS